MEARGKGRQEEDEGMKFNLGDKLAIECERTQRSKETGEQEQKEESGDEKAGSWNTGWSRDGENVCERQTDVTG